jgi:ABC-type polysaccharide/polyol phosphate export permease
MPGPLQAYNDVQPVSVVVKAMRALSIGSDNTGLYVMQAVLWCFALIAIFAPLAVRKYRRAA